mmetsp:Transcript_5228/g.7066  ORF Transcript_5228/g.7066 Transcript_5228/m.7066 type:complete len:342 (+) Transcript_5228:57-1082(+)
MATANMPDDTVKDGKKDVTFAAGVKSAETETNGHAASKKRRKRIHAHPRSVPMATYKPKNKYEGIAMALGFVLVMIACVYHVACRHHIVARKRAGREGAGHASKKARLKREKARRLKNEREYEWNMQNLKSSTEVCRFYAAETLIPHDLADALIGTYTAFDLKEGDVIGFEGQAHMPPLLPHPILKNVRSVGGLCNETSLVATRDIGKGNELYTSYDDPCIATDPSVPSSDDYDRAMDIIDDLVQTARKTSGRSGPGLNRGKVDRKTIQAVKSTIRVFGGTAQLIPDTHEELIDARKKGIVERLGRRAVLWLSENGQCLLYVPHIVEEPLPVLSSSIAVEL